jgi:integrase
MSMGIKKLPSGSWRVQIRRNDLRVDETFPTEAQARDALAKYTNGKPRGKAEMLLQDACVLYFQSLDYMGKRERTKDTEASRMKRILRALGSYGLKAITPDTVEGYIKGRLVDKPKPSSDAIRLEVAALSAVMKFCRKKALIPTNPCIGISRPAAAVVPKRLKREDEGALISLLSHSNYRFRFAARLCLLIRETGARPGEWARASFDDIDFEKGVITFRETKYKGMPRSVPMTVAAERLLADQLEDVFVTNFERFAGADLVFPAVGNDGELRVMHYTGALRDMKKKGLLKKRVRAHTGRHEYISTLLESTDLDDSRIMSLVGHHNPSSMEVYKHVRNIRFRPQIEEIEPERKSERVKAVASFLGVPPRLVEMFLLQERRAQAASGVPENDAELLFTTDFVEKLMAAADKLGTAPKNRLVALAQIRQQIAEACAELMARPDDDPPLTRTIENASIGDRLPAPGTGTITEVMGHPEEAPAEKAEKRQEHGRKAGCSQKKSTNSIAR